MRDAPILGELRALFNDLVLLLRQEIALAKAETQEKIGRAQTGIVLCVAGLLTIFVALFVLANAAVAALALYMDPWAAMLTVGGVLLVISLLLFMAGTRYLSADSLAPKRTMHSVSRAANRVKESVS